jgi:chromosome segregation ATPase
VDRVTHDTILGLKDLEMDRALRVKDEDLADLRIYYDASLTNKNEDLKKLRDSLTHKDADLRNVLAIKNAELTQLHNSVTSLTSQISELKKLNIDRESSHTFTRAQLATTRSELADLRISFEAALTSNDKDLDNLKAIYWADLTRRDDEIKELEANHATSLARKNAEIRSLR